jgi:hypothetical protein
MKNTAAKLKTAQSKAQVLMTELKGEIEDIRQLISEKKREISRIETAPVTMPEALARLEAYIAEQRDNSSLERAFRHFWQPKDHRPEGLSSLVVMSDGEGGAKATGLDRLICDLFAELLIERFKAAGHPDPDSTLPLAGRGERVAAIKREVLAIEREEEAMIVELQALGLRVDRRGGASPEAILEWRD